MCVWGCVNERQREKEGERKERGETGEQKENLYCFDQIARDRLKERKWIDVRHMTILNV